MAMFSSRLVFILVFVVPLIVFAQDGHLDTTFNNNGGPNAGAANPPYISNNPVVRTISYRNDGKILAGGDFLLFNNRDIDNMALLNQDGSLDNKPALVCPGSMYTSAFQNDGKIIIGGSNFLVRLKQDGTPDSTFSVTGLDGIILIVKIQSDGKILIGGSFTTINGISKNRIARLETNGNNDSTFNADANNNVETISLQADGKIIVGGNFNTFNSQTINRLARIKTDGSLDSGFSVGTGPSAAVYATAIQDDGKILVGGKFNTFKGFSKCGFLRLNSDGSIDSGVYGSGVNGEVQAIQLLPTGQILIGGLFSSYTGFPAKNLARLTSACSIDLSFNANPDGQIIAITCQDDQKILIGGYFSDYNGTKVSRIARLNSDASLDTTFNKGNGPNNAVRAVCLQGDGKMIIAGEFTKYCGHDAGYIARVDADGSLDTTFKSGTGANDHIYSLAIQPDGKIIAAGRFTEFNDTIQNHIVRLNPDGTIDPTFQIGTGFNGIVIQIALQNNGKILVSGGFTQYQGGYRIESVRLNPDGSVDPSFLAHTNNNRLGPFAIQDDGKIIMGEVYDVVYNRIFTRLNQDGTIDTGFNTGMGANDGVNAIAIQPDGKIVIGGWLSQYNGVPVGHIARLNPDGTLDNSFNTGTGFDNKVFTIKIQPDGKILVGGWFQSFNGTPMYHLARLNNDGSLDAGFKQGMADETVACIELQPDGKIIIGGLFTSYDGTGRNGLARLNNTVQNSNPTFINTGNNSEINISVYPNPSHGNVSLNIFSPHAGSFETIILNAEGAEVYKFRSTIIMDTYSENLNLDFLPEGFYTIQVITPKDLLMKKLILF